jgi:hypothetical protein|tara:strand:- start:48 stop:941 length:894 start_codon:yes stop_codon:yes gene_type:complete
MKNNNYSRRNFLKTSGKGLALVVSAPLFLGCETLQTNTINKFKLNKVNVQTEDDFSQTLVEINNKLYYGREINTDISKKLNGKELAPNFALIPYKESRTTIKGVGIPGGSVNTDAPQGGLYHPYAFTGRKEDDNGNTTEVNSIYPNGNEEPTRLITNYNIEDFDIKENKENKKLRIHKITENDFQFKEDLLTKICNGAYLVTLTNDFKNHKNILPFYLTTTGFSLEHDQNREDKKVTILGFNYILRKEKTMDDYIEGRGLVDIPQEESREEKRRKEEERKKEGKKKKGFGSSDPTPQ